MKFFLLIALFTSNTVLADNLVPFSYSNEVCSCSGKINTVTHSVKKMESAFNIRNFNSRTNNTNLEDLIDTKLGVQSLSANKVAKAIEAQTKRYNEFQLQLMKLELPAGKKWEEIRTSYLSEASLNQYLEMAQLQYLAKNDSQFLLKEFKGQKVSSECAKYASYLKDNNTIKENIKKFSEKSCKNNMNPSQCEKDAQTSNHRIEILRYGWFNCVNKQFSPKESNDKLVSSALKELEKSISNLKCECDVP